MSARAPTSTVLGVKPSGAHLVVRRYLRTTWLWDKVRVQGGAYGGQCMFDRYSGGFTFVSYRDPNLLATLDIYDRTADFLRNADLSDAELTRNIIGTIGEVDTYRLPDAKGFASMQRHLIGDTDEARERACAKKSCRPPPPSCAISPTRWRRWRPMAASPCSAPSRRSQGANAERPGPAQRVPGDVRGAQETGRPRGAAAQCSFTCGSVRRVSNRATVSRATFTGPCNAVSCIL